MFWRILDFVKELDAKKGPFPRVLDVGSRDINGSVKDALSQNLEFVGIDMIEGPGVDVLMNAHEIKNKISPESFDLVTCCETLEHDDRFWETVEGMKKVLKPGGWLLVTTPSINFFKHDFPHDYYRFTEDAYRDFIFEGFENVHIETYTDEADPVKEKPNNTILGYGQKPK